MSSGVRGHITSNMPIRPANAPSEWEADALLLLEQGLAEEVSEVNIVDGKEYLLFIKPLRIVESCMPCHAFQGYQVGEVRGGISVSVPMAPFAAGAGSQVKWLVASHLVIWLVGIGLLLLSTRRMLKHENERDQAEGQLFQLNLQLEERVQEGIAEVEKRQATLQSFMEFNDSLAYLKDTKYRYTMANGNYQLLSKPYAYLEGRTDEEAGLDCQEVYQKIHVYEEQVLRTQQPVNPKEGFSFDASGRLFGATIFPVLDSNNKLEGIGACSLILPNAAS